MKRFTILILSVFLIVCVLVSCDSAFHPYEFYQSGMTVTLDSSFSRVNAAGYTGCYQSPRATVYTLKEVFNEDLTQDVTLGAYAQMVLQANGMTADVEEKEGYATFLFQKEQAGIEYSYTVCLYKATDAFWMVQFVCAADSYENQKADIEIWADSVAFTKTGN